VKGVSHCLTIATLLKRKENRKWGMGTGRWDDSLTLTRPMSVHTIVNVSSKNNPEDGLMV